MHGGSRLFQLVGEMQELPFGPEDIIKVHRGMNMVKVSVGEHLSEPSEVYITTVKVGDQLATNIVFFLIEPKVRTVYGFEGNPFDPSKRIDVETGAREFVEEMGAILEDIGWESMAETDRESWLKQQFLFPTSDELQGDQSDDDSLLSVQPELEGRAVKEEEQGKVEGELEVEVEGPEEEQVEEDVVEDVILLDTEVEVLDYDSAEAIPEVTPDETVDSTTVEETPEKEAIVENVPEETAGTEDDSRTKRQTGESLEKADGKIVFVEEKFDEMLKQAFLIPPDASEDEDEEESQGNESREINETQDAQDESAEVLDSGPVEGGMDETGMMQTESPPGNEYPEGETTQVHPDSFNTEIILRFLSKM